MAPEAFFQNDTDRNDFMKFTKFLALKGVQIIVHSRKGTKVETDYKKPGTETNWFNLSLQDSMEVTKATKAAFLDDILTTFENNLCVEISLRTVEGDEMVLETWSFGIDPKSDPDHSLKAMSTVYYRMGILLKSLISVTRITPAYKLSRRQSPDSYSLYYQVYTGTPKVDCLGENYKEATVGTLKTPMGALTVALKHRTNMIITPNKHKNELIVKSDHFELSPKHIVYGPKKDREEKNVEALDLTKPLRQAAFVDSEEIDNIVTSFHEKMPRPKSRSPTSSIKIPQSQLEAQPTPEPEVEKCPTPIESPPKKYSWFRSEKEQPLQLLQCPFADRQPIRDLAEFYRDFFNAPQMKNLEEGSVADEEENLEEPETEVPPENVDLSKELEEFENSVQEFDDLIASMHCDNDH